MTQMFDRYAEQIGVQGLRALKDRLLPHQVLMGLDSGTKRWGIAISDDALSVALPLVQYDRRKYAQDFAYLSTIIQERYIGGIVIGLPLHMNATPSPRAQAALQLGSDIEKTLHCGVAYWDERMSSIAMERTMIELADVSRKKRKLSIDKLAAGYILQGALDAIGILK